MVYAHLSDADRISTYNKANSTHHKYQDGNPFHNTNIGSNALAYSIEAGYNLFSQTQGLRDRQKLCLFGRFDHYDSMVAGTYKSQYRHCVLYITTVVFNYHPINWSWNLKETWALILLMVYAVPLHQTPISKAGHPRRYHVYVLAAFLAVLITYFGVNYFMTGMHTYA